MTRKEALDILRESGYQAAIDGKPCDAPTTRELDRASWEIGYRAGKRALLEMEKATQ